ncbi:MAG: ATP-binding protein [Chthoniobacter sp.]|uniref:sensor histidine kinase n=1 Tax=Chthoniobacter sp. TaxID=2510640 RepID=UPI0032A4A6CB
MHFPRSIRWRLQLWYGALLVAVLCGFGFTAYHLESSRRLRQIDEGLQARLSVLLDALRAGPERGQDKKRIPEVRLAPAQSSLFGGPDGYYFVVWMQAAEPIAVSTGVPAGVPKPDSRGVQLRMRGDLRESFLFAAPVNCVLVGRSIGAEQADLHTFGGALAAIGGVVLAAGLLGGWWLVTRAMRPVEEISATATRIAAGDLSQRISTDEADSELGQLAGVLNTTFARLDSLFAQQVRFTADAAHELRTPVAVMLTQTQSALARERPGAEYRETLEACQRATQRMRRLIESLLELARFDAGQESLRRDACDLAKIAGDCLELIRPLAAARRIQIHADLPAAPCRGDAERLAQVVTNLLSNAIDYNREDGEIHVTTSGADGIATLTVRDTGTGIAPNDLPHVFERFQRGDKARTAAAGHSGLGLAITQAIVNAHGGSIEAASEAGAGATFTVKLPAGHDGRPD